MNTQPNSRVLLVKALKSLVRENLVVSCLPKKSKRLRRVDDVDPPIFYQIVNSVAIAPSHVYRVSFYGCPLIIVQTHDL